ncbi:membrane protein insertase YidC [bacterium]|nr:membrane protein insertase YidC [bacterium]
MQSRTWLAVALACLVWFTYMRWFAPPMPEHTAQTQTAPGQAAPATLDQGSGVPVAGSVPTSPFDVDLALPATASIDTKNLHIALSDRGGKIASVEVLDYTATLQKDSPHIASLNATTMVQSLGTFFSEPALAQLGTGAYTRTQAGAQTVFHKDVGDVRVTKSYQSADGNYFLDHLVTLRFPAAGRRDWGFLLMPVGGEGLVYKADHPQDAWEAVAYQNEKIARKTLEALEPGPQVHQGDTKWVAFGNRYFTNVLVNESSINPDVVFDKSGAFSGVYMKFPLVLKEGQQEMVFKFRIFSGPKEYSELAKVPGLRQLIDYGFFSFFAFPLLEVLRFFNTFLHNFGWSIILLTLLVRILFYPLSLKSYKSMKAMQKLQPQLNALKEKYKDDTAKFGQEQMALFRQHKVNPAGGCLPLLMQFPVFVALYAVLQNSIELFHAPFFGWIQDLSSKDPFYVFPVLMGVSMFAQQKMTPVAGMDPMQQKILLLMPVIFSFMMLNLPSGLTIYIFVSTLLGIVQQLLMNREPGKAKALPAT